MTGVITLLDQPRTLDALGRATDALVYFYDTGTTILAPIFNDFDLTDPATNPVELAAGEIFPDIFLDPSRTYRRRILYGDGTIHDVDPLPTSGGDGDNLFYQPAGAGSVNRLVSGKLNEIPSSGDFGAVGDGVVDDTIALQKLFARMAVTKRAYILSGTYKVTGPLTIPPGVLEGGDVVLDFSSALPVDFPSGRCITIQGAVPVQIANLNANLAIGDRGFSFAMAHGLVRDDTYQLSGTVDFAGNGSRAYYRKGEMFEVAEVASATALQSEMVCRDTYPFADVTVWKRSGDRFTQGCGSLTIVGPDTINYIIELISLDKTTISNLRVVGGLEAALAITDCFGVSGNSINVRQSSGVQPSPYGIIVSKSQDVRIKGTAYGYFNGITTGGSQTTGGRIGINRDIHFDGIAGSHPTGGLAGGNFHGNTEYSSLRGVFSNGVVLGGNKNEAHGDFFKSSGFSPVQISEMHGADFIITGMLRTSGPDLPTSVGAVHQTDIGKYLRYGGTTDVRLDMYAPNASRLVVFRPTDLARTDVGLKLAINVMESHPTTRIIQTGRNGTGNELPLIDLTGFKIYDNAVAINWSVANTTKLQGWAASKYVTVTGTTVPTATLAVTFNPAFPRTPVYNVSLSSNVVNGTARQVTGVVSPTATGLTVQVSSTDGTNQTFNALVAVTGSLNEI